MTEQSLESLTAMRLMPRDPNIPTELVAVRDTKRQTYYDRFMASRNNITDFRSVKWGVDGEGNDCEIRCNGNIVLLEVGARIPNGRQAAKNVDPVYVFPAKSLKDWGLKQLSVTQSSHKGFDRVMISEPSRKQVPRFYEYLPINVFKTRDEEIEKFIADNIAEFEALKKEHVTCKFIMMRCNYGMKHRADVECHTYHTHGMDVSELLVESIIKVNEAEVLVLTTALNFKDLSQEGRQLVFDSWFGSCTANGTLTNVENKENAKVQRHKAGALLVALKAALGNDFYQTVYYQLQRDLKEGDNLHMGFQCTWSTFTKAVEEALGPMQKVKRLRNFINTKEHLKGGMSLSNTFYKCSSIIEDTFGKNDVFTT